MTDDAKLRKRNSLRSEKIAAGKLGRTTRRSGATTTDPGDVSFPCSLIEDKYRSSFSFNIGPKLWDTHARKAKQKGERIPVFRVTLEDKMPVAVLLLDDWGELGGWSTDPIERQETRLVESNTYGFTVSKVLTEQLNPNRFLRKPVKVVWVTTKDKQFIVVDYNYFLEVQRSYIEENYGEENV